MYLLVVALVKKVVLGSLYPKMDENYFLVVLLSLKFVYEYLQNIKRKEKLPIEFLQKLDKPNRTMMSFPVCNALP
jgi:hypothetical protein